MTTITSPRAASVAQRAAARTEDAVKVYGKGQVEVCALDRVTVEFIAGRYTAIMGPSGSGKSTLLHCAAGLDTLTSGKAYIGRLASRANDAPFARPADCPRSQSSPAISRYFCFMLGSVPKKACFDMSAE